MADRGERISWFDSRIAVAVAFALAMLIVLRSPIAAGFDRGFGDRADAIIAIAINEHWRNVLSGAEAWNSPLYFFPHADTLGYNDGYFLSGLIYSGWRALADPFLADTLTAATWKALGFGATWWLVRRTFQQRRAVATLVALLFTIANGVFLQAGHAQLNSIALLPIAIILAIESARAEHRGAKVKSRCLAVALAGLIGVWLLTSFYLAWFTLWFVALFAMSSAVLARPRIGTLVHDHGLTLLIFAVAAAISWLPFLVVYLPKAHETGAHPYSETLRFLITPIDLVNVGPDNLAWGWMFRLLPGGNQASEGSWLNSEHQTGFPLVLFSIAALSLWRAARRDQPQVLRAFAIAIVLSWLLALRIGTFSAWLLVNALVPGAKGLRVILRYQLFLLLPLLLLIAEVYRRRLERWLDSVPATAGAIAVLLVFEQLNAADKGELPRDSTLAAFATLPAPSPACQAFYVVTARQSEPIYRNLVRQALYPHNADAMLLAELWRVPTINGFSTFNPSDWNFARPFASDYDQRVIRYARAHGLRQICRLDARKPAQPWSLISTT